MNPTPTQPHSSLLRSIHSQPGRQASGGWLLVNKQGKWSPPRPSAAAALEAEAEAEAGRALMRRRSPACWWWSWTPTRPAGRPSTVRACVCFYRAMPACMCSANALTSIHPTHSRRHTQRSGSGPAAGAAATQHCPRRPARSRLSPGSSTRCWWVGAADFCMTLRSINRSIDRPNPSHPVHLTPMKPPNTPPRPPTFSSSSTPTS